MKIVYFLRARPHLIIPIFAACITLAAGLVVYFIMETYRTVQPIWVEQAAYGQWPMMYFMALINKEGIWSAILQIILQMKTGQNYLIDRHLLQVLVLGFLAPSSLGWFHAPLLIVMPSLAVFLGLFGWTIYKRTGHLGYSVAAMLLFCASAQFARHDWGIGSGFADWQSMFLLSAAILCLINALAQPGLGWIRSFAVLIALAVFARTTAVFYAVIMCAPILLVYLINQYRSEHSFKPLGVTLMNIMAIIAPSAAVVIIQLPNLLLYYGSPNAWNLRKSFAVSAGSIFNGLLIPFVGFPFIAVCITLFVLHILVQNKGIGRSIGAPEIGIYWWGIGYLGFLLLTGYTSNVPKEAMYAVPPFVLVSLSPILTRHSAKSVLYNALAIGLSVLSIAGFSWYSNQNARNAKAVSAEHEALKSMQTEMARTLATLPTGTVWQSYTMVDWGIPVSLVTQYEFGEYRQFGGLRYFYNNQLYWNTFYPSLSLVDLQDRIYTQTLNCIDVAVTLKNPEQQPLGMEDYSYSIAAYVAQRVQSDGNWKFITDLKGWPIGTEHQVYLNTLPVSTRNCNE